MRTFVLFAGLVGSVGAAGCGGAPAPNTAPITSEERQKIEAADRQNDEEESAVDRHSGRKKGRQVVRDEEAKVDR